MTTTMTPTMTAFDAQAWQLSWDRQQEGFMPDREHRFTAMLDAVEAVVDHPAPTVLDLAGGTGSISLRTLQRFPGGRTTLVDVDPVLLTIARGSLDERTTIVPANLSRPDWVAAVGRDSFDAVLTATALHWLEPERVAALYREIHRLLRPGGVFVNADRMPDDGLPALTEALDAGGRRREQRLWTAGAVLSWEAWWDHVTADPTLGPLIPQRQAVFADRHPEETTPNVSWHLQALRAAGFTETGIVWRGGPDAAVAAVR
jgi:SAM-dependent methyltransferase